MNRVHSRLRELRRVSHGSQSRGRFGRSIVYGLAVLLFAAVGTAVRAADSDTAIVARINELLRESWTNNEVEPSPRAEDGEFCRRVCLDVVGHIPHYERLMRFLEDDSPEKRLALVDALLDDPDYIHNWTNIWGNLLVGRDNRRGNRAALDRWLRNAFYRNLPYDKFVYELISAEGSSEENGAVNFLAAHLNNGAVPATAITARIFLGMQVQCTQCHNHPFNDWKQQQFWALNGFFRGTRRRGRRGDVSLTDDPSTNIVFYERRSGLMKATERMFVDGTRVPITDDVKPRVQLAKLITDPSEPYMARAQVNRLWGHFFGYGFTKPIDDMGPHNPPVNPELLNYLAEQFQEAGYDNKRLIRWIAASDAYNLSSSYGSKNAADDPNAGNPPLFSRMYVKNFTAEQLYDSLLIATDADKSNRGGDAAMNKRRQWLRQFVQTFGTDENDDFTTFNGTIPQALVLMNGDLIKSAIDGGKGSFLKKVLDAPNGDIRLLKKRKGGPPRKYRSRNRSYSRHRSKYRGYPAKIETLFLVALARRPTEREMNAFNEVFQLSAVTDPIQGLQDVFWAILNSNEFITNH